jgi:hypothetical protein
MARGTIIGNSLAIGTGMAAVMASEAAQRSSMPKVVRMSTPGDTHLGKDIAEIDRRNFFARLLDRRALRPIDLRIIRSIEVRERW